MSLITSVAPPYEQSFGPPPTPGAYELGRIVAMETKRISPETIGISEQDAPREIVTYGVEDPYVEDLRRRDPGLLIDIQAKETMMSAYARSRRESDCWVREPGTPYKDINGDTQTKRFFEFGDKVSQEAFFNDGGPLDDAAIRAWRTTIPHATALLPLTNPSNLSHVFNRRGEMFEATQKTRDWMTACTDGWEIRNRGTILAEEAREVIAKQAAEEPGEPITMVSVGAGTLLPTLQAAVASGAENVRIVMLENDKKAIAMARHLADELGFKGEIEERRIDVFDPEAMEAVVGELGGQATTVDAVGLYEYINEHLRGSKGANDKEGYLLYEPVQFMKLIYSMVKPGGRMVIGQMRDDRPNSDFTMGVIGWPYVVTRSPSNFMGLIRDAVMERNNTKLSLTPKGVYMMASIDKPAQPTGGNEGMPFAGMHLYPLPVSVDWESVDTPKA